MNKKQLSLFENEQTESTCTTRKNKTRIGTLGALIDEHRDLFEMFADDDLPNDDMRLIADLLGLEAAFLMILKLGGIQLIVPKSGLKKLAKKYIKAKFDGSNVKSLAIKCGVSTTFAYSCINKD
jgi:Mor family transcriptional regulator